MSSKSYGTILAVFIVGYIAIFGTLASLRHYTFQTQTWDLGVFEQTFWNTTQGRIMQNNLEEAPNHLGVHMSPFLFLLVPGFALFPSPYYLLLIQTIAIALGAIPLYLLATKILQSQRWALFLAGIYLLYPPLHWVNFFDFHEIAFFIPLILTGFYFLEMKRYGWSWFFLILAASTKEDAILAVMAVGIWLLIKKIRYYTPSGMPTHDSLNKLRAGFWTSDRKHGVALICVMLIYFFIATKLIMPALGGGLLRLDRYAELGSTPSEIITSLVSHPSLFFETIGTFQKISYAFWLFFPLAFLPFVAFRELVLVIPGLLENMLTKFSLQFSSLYQYDGILIASLFVATLYGLRRVRGWWPLGEKIIVGIFAGAILIAFIFRSPISPLSFPLELFNSNPKWETYRSIIRAVPDNVSIAVPTNILPHLSNREHAYMLGSEPFPVDVVLIDGSDQFGFRDIEAFQTYADSYALSNNYIIRSIDDRYFIFFRKTLQSNSGIPLPKKI